MSKPMTHKVGKGETLEKIARKYRIKDWKSVYNHPLNGKFRKLRPKPDLIQPGDILLIPPPSVSKDGLADLDSMIKAQKTLIMKLETIKKEAASDHKKYVGEVEAAAKGYKKTSAAVDMAATLSMLMINFGKIAKKGAETMAKNGKELQKANAEVAKQISSFRGNMIKDLAAKPAAQKKIKPILEEAADDGKIDALETSLIVYESWSDMTSPSFWGKTFVQLQNSGFLDKVAKGKLKDAAGDWKKAVNFDPQREFSKQIKSMKDQASNLQKKLDANIAKNQKVLNELLKIQKELKS